MIKTIENRHRIMPIPAYYELNAQYAMYIERDYDRALYFLDEGDNKFPNSPYILRTYFDCFELKKDIHGMKNVLEKLKKCADLNRPNKISYQRRYIIYEAYNGKSFINLKLQIYQLNILTDSAREKLIKRVQLILE